MTATTYHVLGELKTREPEGEKLDEAIDQAVFAPDVNEKIQKIFQDNIKYDIFHKDKITLFTSLFFSTSTTPCNDAYIKVNIEDMITLGRTDEAGKHMESYFMDLLRVAAKIFDGRIDMIPELSLPHNKAEYKNRRTFLLQGGKLIETASLEILMYPGDIPADAIGRYMTDNNINIKKVFEGMLKSKYFEPATTEHEKIDSEFSEDKDLEEDELEQE